jgi:hypothetical protein
MIMRISVGVYVLLGALLIFGGANYLIASEFMPYHAQAIQADWSSLSPEHQGLILSLMKGRGAGAVSLGVAVVLLAVLGLPRRVALVFWLLPLQTLVYLSLATYSTYFMHATTSGGPPLVLGFAAGALTLVGAILSYMGR